MAAILVLADGRKINSICPVDKMKTNFKFEVDRGNGFKDIAFTSIIFDSTYTLKFNSGHLGLSKYHVHTLNYNHFLNHDGGHLGFSRWQKNQ